MLEYLMNSPAVWAIINISTMVSVVFGIVTWIMSKNKKRISYAAVAGTLKKNININTIVKDSEKNIQFLNSIRVVIWNSGNDFIDKKDVVETKELVITGERDVGFVSAYIVWESDSTNKFNVEIRENKIHIDFEYINSHQGAVLQIFYTGNASDFKLDYIIKGGCSSNKIVIVTSELLKSILKKDFKMDLPIILLLIFISINRGLCLINVFPFYILISVIIMKYCITGYVTIRRLKCPKELRKHCVKNLDTIPFTPKTIL